MLESERRLGGRRAEEMKSELVLKVTWSGKYCEMQRVLLLRKKQSTHRSVQVVNWEEYLCLKVMPTLTKVNDIWRAERFVSYTL